MEESGANGRIYRGNVSTSSALEPGGSSGLVELGLTVSSAVSLCRLVRVLSPGRFTRASGSDKVLRRSGTASKRNVPEA
jgi:hypothetical protein